MLERASGITVSILINKIRHALFLMHRPPLVQLLITEDLLSIIYRF